MRRFRNLSLTALLALALGGAAVFLYFCNLRAEIFLHPTRVPPSADLLTASGIPFQDIQLTTSDGVRLAAWYTPPRNGALILLAHGYNGVRPPVLYAMFVRHGYGVLAWDFRAHGASGGDISTLGDFEQADVDAALDFARAQPEVERVGAWGGSMGGATVLLSAAKRPEIQAVVADGAYPALQDVIRINLPAAWMTPFVSFFIERDSGAALARVRAVDAIARIQPRPVFLIDGWSGGAIQMDAPYRLFAAAGEPKQLWVGQGVGHMGMFDANPVEYERRVLAFFDTYLSQP